MEVYFFLLVIEEGWVKRGGKGEGGCGLWGNFPVEFCQNHIFFSLHVTDIRGELSIT